MKLILSLLSGVALISSMSSCTTYVEDRHEVGMGGYRGTSRNYHTNYHTNDYNHRADSRDYHPAGHDSHVRVSSHSNDTHHSSSHHTDTRVKAKVRGPLGVSTGAAVDVR